MWTRAIIWEGGGSRKKSTLKESVKISANSVEGHLGGINCFYTYTITRIIRL